MERRVVQNLWVWILGAGAVLAAAALGLAAPAWGEAETTGEPQVDVTGRWVFQTAPIAEGACDLTGVMEIEPVEEGGYACSFTTTQTCVDDTMYESVQSCTASIRSGALVILSEVTQVFPEEATPYYYRDNFVLRELSDTEMRGHLTSIDTAAVRFWREVGAVS